MSPPHKCTSLELAVFLHTCNASPSFIARCTLEVATTTQSTFRSCMFITLQQCSRFSLLLLYSYHSPEPQIHRSSKVSTIRELSITLLQVLVCVTGKSYKVNKHTSKAVAILLSITTWSYKRSTVAQGLKSGLIERKYTYFRKNRVQIRKSHLAAVAP